MTIVLPPGPEYDVAVEEIGDCGRCGAALRKWGHGRWRVVREGRSESRVRPRRVRCSGCGVTHVVLPADMLVRRRDAVTAVGAAWRGFAAGIGVRRMARRLNVPRETARGWQRRLGRGALARWGPPAATGPDRLAAALEHLCAEARDAGWHQERDIWRYVAHRSQGLLLFNTN